MCVWVSLVVPGCGWAPVSSMLELGTRWGAAQPCSAVTHGTGMGQAMLFASPCHRPAASSFPVLCHCPSQLAVGGPSLMFPQPMQALGRGQLTHAGGEKRVPLLRVRGLAVLCLPPEQPGCSRGVQSPCALPVHPCKAPWRNTSAPLASSLGLQPPGASRCSCGCPALPRPRVAPGGSLADRMSSVGGSSRTR